MVGEDEVGRQQLAERRGVRLDPVVELGARALLDELHLVALVAVEHEDRQQATDVGPHEPRAPEVVTLRVRLLAEDGHVVAGARSIRARAPACRRSSPCLPSR